MKKFNYQFTIEAPSKEIADFIMKLICNENMGVIADVKSENPSAENSAEKKSESDSSEQNKAKESLLKSMEEFEKVIHIIKCCIADNTLIDRLARILGFKKQLTPTKA